MLDHETVELWREISSKYTGKAIFAYMTQTSVADVVEYFGIDIDHDLPMIAAHQPTTDSKFKSSVLSLDDGEMIEEFIEGVLSGNIAKVIKSEPIPRNNPGPVLKAVGNNVLDIIKKVDTDVLLAVYVPWCAQCKKLIPALDLLGRAVQGEQKISIVKIDALANDIPKTWGVKSYPSLIWFPAKDKPYASNELVIPRPYWDAGFSLQEMLGFVLRDSSFDVKTLRVATSEQIGSLLADEEGLRAKYEEEERKFRRNEGRVVYEEPWVDWLVGEVIFDGKRWHVAALAMVSLCWVLTIFYTCFLLCNANTKVVKKKKVV